MGLLSDIYTAYKFYKGVKGGAKTTQKTRGTKTSGASAGPMSAIQADREVMKRLAKGTGMTENQLAAAIKGQDPRITKLYETEMDSLTRQPAMSMDDVTPSTMERVVDIVAPVASGVTRGVGMYQGIKHGILGTALNAMYAASPKSAVSTNPWGTAAALANAQTAKGAMWSGLTNIAADTIDREHSIYKAGKEKERMLKTQQYYNPNTGYWQAYNGLTSGKHVPSDERLKDIHSKFKEGSPMDEADLLDLAAAAGIDLPESDEGQEQSVLDGYADNIANYLYQYKPEATAIDGSIDPDQVHIGPMAQDIEKVNPACIVETPEGAKTVDTGRLALMNAGAIADLARDMREVKEALNG